MSSIHHPLPSSLGIMKIRIIKPASVLLSEGNVVEVPDYEAEALIRTSVAEEVLPEKPKVQTPKREYF